MDGRLLLSAGILALSLAGCSDDDASDDALPSAGPTVSASPSVSATAAARATGTPDPALLAGLPTPVSSIDDRADAWGEALDGGDCREIVPFVASRIRGVQPGTEPTAAECDRYQQAFTDFAGFDPIASEVFGPAAVVDAMLKGQTVTSAWILEKDGNWRIDINLVTTPTDQDPDVHSVGSDPDPGNTFAENAVAWVDAWRSGKCAELFEYTDPSSAFIVANGGETGLCKVVTDSFDQENGIGRVLADSPAAEPVLVGAVEEYGFSILRTDNGIFTLISVVQADNLSAADKAGHRNYAVYELYRNTSV